MIELISATRLSPDDFWSKSALGLSLKRMAGDERVLPFVMFQNEIGLPDIFNSRIPAPDGHDILVFIHDDVWIDDYFLVDRVIDGLRSYDVIGVAGNRRRVKNQIAWPFVDEKRTFDDKGNLSGCVAHGDHAFGWLHHFGDVPAACELLDGLFLATRKSTLMASGVRFDRRFDFHFYDMDFCRSARQAGLRLGTWPICLTHQSTGLLGSERWREKSLEYIEKWKD